MSRASDIVNKINEQIRYKDSDICICTKCGFSTDSNSGTSCAEYVCPQCGSTMSAKPVASILPIVPNEAKEWTTYTVNDFDQEDSVDLVDKFKKLGLESPKDYNLIDANVKNTFKLSINNKLKSEKSIQDILKDIKAVEDTDNENE